MSFFPYTCCALRCHPAAAVIQDNELIGGLTISAHVKVEWLCVVCDRKQSTFVFNLIRSSCRCSEHSKQLHNRHRKKFTGTLPLQLTCPIRAGLLLNVDREALINLITTMLPVTEVANRHQTAAEYVEEVSQCDRMHLVDNTF